MKKKLTALLLTLTMLVTFMPAMAFAAEDGHVHGDWTFKAKGKDRIVATCGVEGCDAKAFETEATLEVVKDAFYTGSAYNGAEVRWTKDAGIASVITFKQGENVIANPIEPGKYTAVATIGGLEIKKDFNIGKKSPVVKAPVANTLVYTGEAQELVKAGEAETGYTMKYAVVKKNNDKPGKDKISEAIPTAIEDGTYYVYYVVECEPKDEVFQKDEGWVEVEIAGLNPITTYPTAKLVVANGEEQELVNQGVAVDGFKIQYALGKDDQEAPKKPEFKDAVPTAKEVGTYYVWYSVDTKPNDHYDNVAGCITVQIYQVAPPAPTPEPTDPLKDAKVAAEQAVLAAAGGVELTGELKTVFDKAVEVILAADTEARVAEAQTLYVKMMGTTKVVNAVKVEQLKPGATKKGIYVKFKKADLIAADDTTVTSVKYEIKRAINKKFTKKVKNYTKKSGEKAKVTFKNAKKLKKGRKYYYQVRGAVTFVDGTVVHTQWSKTKAIKAKKSKK